MILKYMNLSRSIILPVIVLNGGFHLINSTQTRFAYLMSVLLNPLTKIILINSLGLQGVLIALLF